MPYAIKILALCSIKTTLLTSAPHTHKHTHAQQNIETQHCRLLNIFSHFTFVLKMFVTFDLGSPFQLSYGKSIQSWQENSHSIEFFDAYLIGYHIVCWHDNLYIYFPIKRRTHRFFLSLHIFIYVSTYFSGKKSIM